MEKISFKSLSKAHQFIFVLSFVIFLMLFSVVWRVIFAQTAPPTFSNVVATNIIGPGAQITWTTSEPANFPWVQYGTTAGSGTQTNFSCSNDLNLFSTTHCINLVGLSPNTVYHYVVKSSNSIGQGTSGDFTFTSAAIVNNPPPMPSAPTGPSTGTVGAVYNYSAMLSPDPEGQQVKAIFDWGDGTSFGSSTFITPSTGGSAAPSVSHSWSTAGTYGVRAKAVDSNGAESGWTGTYNMNIAAAAGTEIPAAPTNLAATISGTSTSVTLTWTDNSSNETGFKIYRGPTWTDIGNVGANVTTFVDSGRGTGTYTYHINAFNSSSGTPIYSSVSNDATITVATSTSTDTTAPSTPPVPTLNIVSASQINLSWPASSDNVGVTGYKVYRCNCGNTSNMVLLTTVTGLTYSDTGLSGFTTYTYAVAAFDAAGNNSPQGPGASGTTAAGSGGTVIFPLAPSNLHLNGATTSSSILLAWNDNSNNEDKFYIHRKLTTDSTWPTSGNIFQLSSNTTTYTDNSVQPGMSYDYRVQACSSSNACSDFSYLIGTMTLGTPVSPTSTTAPVAPTNLAGTVSGSNVTLTWTDNSSNETGFKIYRGPTWTDIGNVGANVTTFVDSGRGTGTYTYHINAFNSSNIYSPVSNDVSVNVTATTATGTTLPTLPTIPSSPTNLLINNISTPTFISLYWTDNSNNEDSFHLERKLSSTSTWSTLTQTDSNTIFYIDTTGASNATYDYRVQACLSGTGCSNYANLEKVLISSGITPNATTLVTPSAPTNLILTSTTLPPVQLHWTDNSNNEDGFSIERRLSSTTTWATLTHTGPNIINYIDTTGAPGATYDYRVQACLSGAGCSNYANLERVLVSITTTVNGTTTTSSTSTTTTPVVSTTTTSSTATKTSTPTPAAVPITQTTVAPGDIPPQTTIQTTSQTTTQTTTAVATTNEFSSKVQGLGLVVEERKIAVDNSKAQLVKTINESVADIINNAETSGQKADTSKIYTLRDELLIKVDSSLGTLVAITPTDINNLQKEISKGIDNIRTIAGENIKIAQTNNVASINITNTLNTLSGAVSDQSATLKAQGADLLYKDSNKDGISDYDSVYVYNISPTAPSPTSTYEGKTINASEKILLGFDPTKSDIVKVNKEEPAASTAAVVPTYKVKEVALTDKKEVIFKGQALPNSFITIYIYSTPIIVTVKTDSSGAWQYVLDKELDNGDHTVYTATVNNSGNIIAKSSGFLFTKTAEAATLKDIPLIGAPVNTTKPGLLEGNSIYVIILAIAAIVIIILTLIGITSKKNKENI